MTENIYLGLIINMVNLFLKMFDLILSISSFFLSKYTFILIIFSEFSTLCINFLKGFYKNLLVLVNFFLFETKPIENKNVEKTHKQIIANEIKKLSKKKTQAKKGNKIVTVS